MGDHSRFDGHVGAEEDLGDIVEEFDGVGVHGWEKGHDLRADNDEGQVHQCDGASGAEVAEPPALNYYYFVG